MILFPSRNVWKYGRVEKMISKYCYEVQLKYGRSFQGHQVIDRANIIVLFTPKQTSDTKTESKPESTNDPKTVSKDESKS